MPPAQWNGNRVVVSETVSLDGSNAIGQTPLEPAKFLRVQPYSICICNKNIAVCGTSLQLVLVYGGCGLPRSGTLPANWRSLIVCAIWRPAFATCLSPNLCVAFERFVNKGKAIRRRQPTLVQRAVWYFVAAFRLVKRKYCTLAIYDLVTPAMEQALQLWKAFDSWADVQEREVASFLAPDFDYDARATKGWFGTKLSHALAAVAVYGVLVIIGMIRYQKVEKTKEKASSVVAAFQQEPIRFLQVIYNAAQVGLCGWMMVAAFVSAREQGYSLVCNKFDPSSTRMASIEWVFYLSKVCESGCHRCNWG